MLWMISSPNMYEKIICDDCHFRILFCNEELCRCHQTYEPVSRRWHKNSIVCISIRIPTSDASSDSLLKLLFPYLSLK